MDVFKPPAGYEMKHEPLQLQYPQLIGHWNLDSQYGDMSETARISMKFLWNVTHPGNAQQATSRIWAPAGCGFGMFRPDTVIACKSREIRSVIMLSG